MLVTRRSRRCQRAVLLCVTGPLGRNTQTTVTLMDRHGPPSVPGDLASSQLSSTALLFITDRLHSEHKHTAHVSRRHSIIQSISWSDLWWRVTELDPVQFAHCPLLNKDFSFCQVRPQFHNFGNTALNNWQQKEVRWGESHEWSDNHTIHFKPARLVKLIEKKPPE